MGVSPTPTSLLSPRQVEVACVSYRIVGIVCALCFQISVSFAVISVLGEKEIANKYSVTR